MSYLITLSGNVVPFRSYLHRLWHSLYLINRLLSELNKIISGNTKKNFYTMGRVRCYHPGVISQVVLVPMVSDSRYLISKEIAEWYHLIFAFNEVAT